MRELLAVANERNHDVVCIGGAAHDGMAQKAATAVLVIGLDPKLTRQTGDGVKDGARLRVFYQAALARHELVRAQLVHAMDELAARCRLKRRHALGAVSQRLVHPQDGIRLYAKGLKELFECLVLALKLDLIGDGQPLATAAIL